MAMTKPTSEQVTFLQTGTGATARTVDAKLKDTVSVKDFGAVGDGVTDDTAAIQAAINSISSGTLYFPAGKYKVTSTLTINGLIQNVNLLGSSYTHGGQPVSVFCGCYLVWYGSSGGVILQLSGVIGNIIKNIWFQDGGPSLVAPAAEPTVYGIRYTTIYGTKFNTIENCQFRDLYAGVHYHDDTLTPTSDNNMDGQLIDQCIFSQCFCSILVNQTNVYDTSFRRCDFYGGVFSKYHVWVKKGHCYLEDCYTGPLRSAADGIAIYVQSGLVNVTNVYSETNYAPFYVWEIAQPAGIGATISGCWLASDPLTNPQTYDILNSTSSIITLIGGRVTKGCKQTTATNGGFISVGCSTFPDVTGIIDRLVHLVAPGAASNTVGQFGTNPSKVYGGSPSLGGGIATLAGFTPELRLYNYNYSDTIATKIITGTGTPESVVTAEIGSLFLRKNGGAGTTLYVKESGSSNTGWVAK